MKGMWLTLDDKPYEETAKRLSDEGFTDGFIFSGGSDPRLGELSKELHNRSINSHLCVDCFSNGLFHSINRYVSIIEEVTEAQRLFGIDGYNLDYVRLAGNAWGNHKKVSDAVWYIVNGLKHTDLISSASIKMELYDFYWLNKLFVKYWYGVDYDKFNVFDWLMPMCYSKLYSAFPLQRVTPLKIKRMCNKLQERTSTPVFPSLQAYYSEKEPNSIGRLPTLEELKGETSLLPSGYALFLYNDWLKIVNQ